MRKLGLILALAIGFYSFSNSSNSSNIINALDIPTKISVQDTVLVNGTSRTLRATITKLNDSGTIQIKGKIRIDEPLTIPSGITLKVSQTGSLELKTDATLKVHGNISAGLYPIFNSNVEFSEDSRTPIIHSEWFGNNDLAVNYALFSAGKIPVEITNNITVTRAILINSNQTLRFSAATIYTARPMTGGAVIKNRGPKNSEITIIGGTIDGSRLTNVAYDAIKLTNVNLALIKGVVCKSVHITASKDTGNFHLINCTNTLVKDVEAHDTWKMGIKVDGGSFNTISGGYFTGTHDSGIGAIDSPNMHVDGVYVDNCGTSNASNITMNLQNGVFENSISINASGSANGNGLTVGHEGYPAFNSIVRNNLFINNATKGVFIQGSTNTDISVSNNIIMHNGNDSLHDNSAGITTYFGVSNTTIFDNEIIENLRGINMTNTSKGTKILNNRVTANTLYGIDSDGINSVIQNNELSNATNLFHDTEELNLKLQDNLLNDQQIPSDYTYLKSLPWLTDLQKEVLSKFIKDE